MTQAKGEKRNSERERNYQRGNFGSHKYIPFTNFEKSLISYHIIPDRVIAILIQRNVRGIQALRWRIKNNYKNLYG